MKVMVVDTYYPAVLKSLNLDGKNYHDAWQFVMGSFFGVSDAYSSNLKPLKIDAHEVIANYKELQELWCNEKGILLPKNTKRVFNMKKGIIPWISREEDRSWIYKALAAQVEHLSPDIVFIHDLNYISAEWLEDVRKKSKVVGQIGCEQNASNPFHLYDLLLTSFPHFVLRYREMGFNIKYFRLGFDRRILDLIDTKGEKDIDVSFIGGINTDAHYSTIPVLEAVAEKCNFKWWGYGVESLPNGSPLRGVYQGEVWGLEMYRLLSRSKITLNRHNKTAENFANNMRLYEATGVGTLLLTDYKDNLSDLFEPEKEVVTYRSPEDAVEKIKHYLANGDERKKVAKAGHERTLREHTYDLRMIELADIFRTYL